MVTPESEFEVAARIAHVEPLVGLDKKVQPAHTALLVIDMQNDFIASAGLVGRSGRDVSAAQKLAEYLPDFIAAARRGVARERRGIGPAGRANGAGKTSGSAYLKRCKEGAPRVGLDGRPDGTVFPSACSRDMEAAIADLGREAGGGLIVPPDNFSYVHRALMFALAARHRVPAVYPFRFMAREGGLVSYGVDLGETFPRAAEYIDRILQG